MYYSPFKKFLVEEDNSTEVVSHLPHIGELLYTGNSFDALAHLEAIHSRLQGKTPENHNLSYKADGKVSIVFGKRNGIPFVKYKGKGSPELFTEQQIRDHINLTGKLHLEKPFLYGLQAAKHTNINDDHSYQGDVMIPDEESNKLMGNIVKYIKPRSSVSNAIGVHTQLQTSSGKKIKSNPDVSFLETSGSHFPPLSLNNHKFQLGKKDSDEIQYHIGKAKEILSDPSIIAISSEIARHRDPTNKTGHRYLHLVKFSNAVQRGTHSRDIHSLINWTNDRAAIATGKEQQRLQMHAQYIHKNRNPIHHLLQAHNHIDHARSMMIDVIHQNKQLPMTPDGGHSNGEGFVSELNGSSQVKLVPTSFTIRNNENKERFSK